MRFFPGLSLLLVFLVSCDDARLYETNADFDHRYWAVGDKPEFVFEVTDSLADYNLYCNVRNSVDYPYANIFLTYYLTDSAGTMLEEELVRQTLFDEKTGEPFGESGLGDIYDHRIPLLMNYRFPYAGKYKVSFQQYMRTDTLSGVLAVGLRVEKATGEEKL